MKIILSRKGFDSKYGKGYSPILPSGTMLSMPIPASGGERGVRLKDIIWRDRSYTETIEGLYPKLKGDELFHFDPELHRASRKGRHEDWLPAFGQAGSAQSHLVSQKVEVGDLFLFFGSFVRTYRNDENELYWEKEHEFHAIFGYLQIGEVLDPTAIANGEKRSLYSDHPHFLNQKQYGDLNALYIAREQLKGTSWPGAGTLHFREDLRLTRPGFKKSQWMLPSFFHPDEGTVISRCSNSKRYRKAGDRLQFEPVSLGQDMVVKDSSGRVADWAKNLILEGQAVMN